MDWGDIQVINIGKEWPKEYCRGCGASILDVANIKYDGKKAEEPRHGEELYKCRKCGANFVIRYEFFDADGHIHPRVFSGDVNDKSFDWQSLLTDVQKGEISKHLESCETCQKRLTEETLNDALFANFLHSMRKGRL